MMTDASEQIKYWPPALYLGGPVIITANTWFKNFDEKAALHIVPLLRIE